MSQDDQALRRAEAEAADWYVRMDTHSVAQDDVLAFFAWRRNPLNAAAYARMEDVRGAAARLRHDPDLRAAAREALARPVWRRRLSERLTSPAGRLVVTAALAASLLGALSLGYGQRGPRYATDIGEQMSVQLDDGSTLRLNTDSRLRVRFNGQQRRVLLDRGEAFFQVAHDSQRPFLVQAGGAQVRAIGTRFDVRRDGQRVRVVLTQGVVVVDHPRAPDAAVTLKPGQAVNLTAGDMAQAETVDSQAAVSWTQGQLTFHDRPLSEAVAEVNRYSRRKVTLGGGAPAQARVNGVFEIGDIDTFVAAVSEGLDLTAERRADGRVALAPRRAAGGD
jgi:transmembrane sensor